MPTQKRLRADKEHAPGASRQDTTECGQQQTVIRREHRLRSLASQNREFVSQHQDLQVLRGVPACEHQKETQHAANDEIHERRQQTSKGRGRRRYRAPPPTHHHPLSPGRVCAPHEPGSAIGVELDYGFKACAVLPQATAPVNTIRVTMRPNIHLDANYTKEIFFFTVSGLTRTPTTVTLAFQRDPPATSGICTDQGSQVVTVSENRDAHFAFKAPAGIVNHTFCDGTYTATVLNGSATTPISEEVTIN
jgi:hypothetical protein